MARGQLKAGTVIGAPRKYPQELRDRVKRRYLTMLALGYDCYASPAKVLEREFAVPYWVVVHLLQQEEVM